MRTAGPGPAAGLGPGDERRGAGGDKERGLAPSPPLSAHPTPAGTSPPPIYLTPHTPVHPVLNGDQFGLTVELKAVFERFESNLGSFDFNPLTAQLTIMGPTFTSDRHPLQELHPCTESGSHSDGGSLDSGGYRQVLNAQIVDPSHTQAHPLLFNPIFRSLTART